MVTAGLKHVLNPREKLSLHQKALLNLYLFQQKNKTPSVELSLLHPMGHSASLLPSGFPPCSPLPAIIPGERKGEEGRALGCPPSQAALEPQPGGRRRCPGLKA